MMHTKNIILVFYELPVWRTRALKNKWSRGTRFRWIVRSSEENILTYCSYSIFVTPYKLLLLPPYFSSPKILTLQFPFSSYSISYFYDQESFTSFGNLLVLWLRCSMDQVLLISVVVITGVKYLQLIWLL